MVVAAIGLLVIAAYFLAIRITRSISIIHWQQQCLAHAAAPTQETCTLISEPDQMFRTTHMHMPPPYWLNFSRNVGMLGGGIHPVLYLHERHTSSGERLLICVNIQESYTSGLLVNEVSVRPGTWLRWPELRDDSRKWLPLQEAELTHIYAGQSDPKDASHFTIAYSADGTPGVIDGWVEDNGRIRLQPRGP
jgi:hypothetical protein